MRICSGCGKTLTDDARFCDGCGKKVVLPVFCAHCGKSLSATAAFCSNCGTAVAGRTPAPGPAVTPVVAPEEVTFVPAEPAAPSEPTVPEKPVTPAEPAAPSEPTVPEKPVTPAEPAAPAESVAPEKPAVPAEPVMPVEPVVPVKPVTPMASVTPVTPVTSVEVKPVTPVQSAAPGASTPPVMPYMPVPPKKKKNGGGKVALFGGIALAAVLLIVAGFWAVTTFLGGSGRGSQPKVALYVKDREILYNDLKGNDSLEVTARLADDKSISNSDMADAGYGLGAFIAFGDNGNRIFYPDRISDSDEGINLFYRNLNRPDEEPVRIDTGIIMYAVNPAGTRVIYVKGEDHILYSHDLTEKDKIATDVYRIYVSEDCQKVLYVNYDGSVYLRRIGEDASTRLVTNVSELYYVSKDLSVIYYERDDSLYRQTQNDENREKIASDVYSVVQIYETGEVYYTKAETRTLNMMDYVYDDMAEADAALTEPVYPDQPNYPKQPYAADFETQEEYEAAYAQYQAAYTELESEYNRQVEAYWEADAAYGDKQFRDYIRQDLGDQTLTNTVYSLYYYDGAETVKVADILRNWTCSRSNPLAVIQVRDAIDVRVALSDIENSYEIHDRVEQALRANYTWNIVSRGEATQVNVADAEEFYIAPDGSAVYCLAKVTEDDCGELYRIPVTNGKPNGSELYDDEVSEDTVAFLEDGTLIYFKNVSGSDDKGDLYVDKKEVDYDVRLDSPVAFDGGVLYYADWSNSLQNGTLKLYKNGTRTKIADDVHQQLILAGKELLYLYDFSPSSYTGTLYRYAGGQAQKLEEDVMTLIPVLDIPVCGAYYYLYEYYGW